MKRNFIFATLVCAAASVFFSTSLHAQTSTYNFIQLGADDLAAVQKDTKLWTVAGTQIKNAAVLGKAGNASDRKLCRLADGRRQRIGSHQRLEVYHVHSQQQRL